jgi:hypothetical protein
LLIPAAYRSLSRPSSPLRAKASPVYPFLLSSTHTPFARMVCFLILVAFIGSPSHQFIGIATLVPLFK